MIFSIVVYGQKEAQRYIEGISDRAANARPAFEEIYLTILDIEAEAFEREGERSGFPKWAALLLSTVIRKAKAGQSPQILRATDRLMNAMTTYRSPDAYTRIERDKIVFAPKRGGAAFYGLFHKRGYKIKAHEFGGSGHTRVEPRDFIRFSESDANAFAREIARYLTRKTGPSKMGLSFG